MTVTNICEKAKQVSYELKALSTEDKNKILKGFSEYILKNSDSILEANSLDLESARQNNISESMLDRLSLDKSRIVDIASSLEELIELNDPVGEIVEEWTTSDDLNIKKMRVPIGVIGIIYEARPNVTVDAACICVKTGNTVVLKGGKEAINSNIALVKTMQEYLIDNGYSKEFIQLIESTDRATTMEFMTMNKYIDVLIPRGSERLINAVVQNSSIPVLETGAGNCHIYVDKEADQNMALDIIENAKVQRPSVCNAVEKVLIHEDISTEFTDKLFKRLKDKVKFKGDKKSLDLMPIITEITEDELYTEFLDYVLGVIIVENVDKAITHINKYSSTHSESIITGNFRTAEKFLTLIDSSTVYHNASTRFTDGGKFGYGAEIGISTSKLHARGPMGLKEMTTTKNVVYGTGQVRT